MSSRPRGRPRAFDPEVALDEMVEMFWTQGYAATSLDDIAATTGLKRSSLYAAFGNKQAMYLAVTERFADAMRAELARIPHEGIGLRARLGAFFARVIAIYTAGETPRGCLIFGTAPSEAVSDPVIAARLGDILAELDATLAALFAAAIKAGEVRADTSAEAAGRACAAIQHSLSLRARAGASVPQLQEFVTEALEFLPWA